MQVAISCRHGTISSSVQEHISQKAEKLLTYFERVTAINVTVDLGADRVGVELLVDAEHKHSFVARDEGSDVRSTFDRVMQKMEQQIRKYKEKLQDHRRDRPLNEITAGDQEGSEAE